MGRSIPMISLAVVDFPPAVGACYDHKLTVVHCKAYIFDDTYFSFFIIHIKGEISKVSMMFLPLFFSFTHCTAYFKPQLTVYTISY